MNTAFKMAAKHDRLQTHATTKEIDKKDNKATALP